MSDNDDIRAMNTKKALERDALIIECWVGNGYCCSNVVSNLTGYHNGTVSRALSKYFQVPNGEVITLKSKV